MASSYHTLDNCIPGKKRLPATKLATESSFIKKIVCYLQVDRAELAFNSVVLEELMGTKVYAQRVQKVNNSWRKAAIVAEP